MNVGCIPSKSLLNNSHLYHQILHDTKGRGIEVGDVKLNLPAMMKAKDSSVSGLTKGIEFLFKKNNVEYIKGTGAFQDEHTIAVNLTEGGETTVRGKNILIATGSEATPFPGLTIDEQKVITSTGAIALQEVPQKMTVIGGGIIGLEMVWRRSIGYLAILTLDRPPFGRASALKLPLLNSWARLAAPVWTTRLQSRPRRSSKSKV